MTPEMELRRGEEARLLLENPLFSEAFDQFEAEITEKWRSSPARDEEGREKLWMMLQAAKRARTHLESLVEHGKMAQHTLAQRAKAALRGERLD